MWWIMFLVVAAPGVVRGTRQAPALVLVACVTAFGGLMGLVISRSRIPLAVRMRCAGVFTVLAAGLLGSTPLQDVLLLLLTFAAPFVLRPAWVVVRKAPADLSGLWSSMTGSELCVEWAESFAAVKVARTIEDRAVATAVRQQVLDELERRDASAFTDWLDHDPTPATEPGWVRNSSMGP